MKGLALMIGGSLVSFGIVAPLVDPPARLAVLLGLLGPLVIAGVSWVWMEKTHRTRPQAMTSVMVVGFGVKLVFVGAYVAITLGLLAVRQTPFVISFAGYFIALYAVEAMLLKRMLGAERPSAAEL